MKLPANPETPPFRLTDRSAAAVSANYSTVAVGQEGLASIRRPSTWNCIAGMRPTAGLVSRGGVYGCWPEINGSLGPMARTVTDLAALLDAMAGYDPEDPVTARGVGHIPDSFKNFLDGKGLKGARIGVLRQSMGLGSEPDSGGRSGCDGASPTRISTCSAMPVCSTWSSSRRSASSPAG